MMDKEDMKYHVISYEVEEVFSWGGISMFFSVYASISRVGVPSQEIDFWLNFRYVNKFNGAIIYQKLENSVM